MTRFLRVRPIRLSVTILSVAAAIGALTFGSAMASRSTTSTALPCRTGGPGCMHIGFTDAWFRRADRAARVLPRVLLRRAARKRCLVALRGRHGREDPAAERSGRELDLRRWCRRASPLPVLHGDVLDALHRPAEHHGPITDRGEQERGAVAAQLRDRGLRVVPVDVVAHRGGRGQEPRRVEQDRRRQDNRLGGRMPGVGELRSRSENRTGSCSSRSWAPG